MKYVNSLKFMNSFPSADAEGISNARALELCRILGRVNIGTNSIFVPGGAAGHATAVMLESVIKAAGYKVGRISLAEGFDSRSIVYLDGSLAPIEDYNRGVSELKSATLKAEGIKFKREEACFALALLLCKLHASDYVILEGMSNTEYDLSSLCAPYDLVVIPAINGDREDVCKTVCNAIRHGVREVVSGNQKKQIYDKISNACVSAGARLTVTSKQSFKVENVSGIKLTFTYADRDGYTLKTPSITQRECAMLVIDSALAIRRNGIKLPWAAISSGLSNTVGTGCFEMISASPLLIIDSAETIDELDRFKSTLDSIFSKDDPSEISLCFPENAENEASFLHDRTVKKCIILSSSGQSLSTEERLVCKSVKECARELFSMMKSGEDVICFGSVSFALAMIAELRKN